MSDLLHGVWQDLREKRLWPVAVVLLVALVAVPVLLFKDGGEDAGPAPAPAAPEAADLPTASLAQDRSSQNSDLGVFDPKDPFRPANGYPRPPGSASGGGNGGIVPTPSGVASTGGGATGGGSTGAVASSGSSGSSSSGSGPTTTTEPRTTTHKRYTYVVDIRFGERGEVRSLKGVHRMKLLPSSRNPLLVFLGVSANRRSAIFLVDSGLSQAGEGTCRPSKRYCSFLYLRTADGRDDHFFSTDEGRQYSLHLSRIRRVEVKPTKKKRARPAARSSDSPVGPGATFESPIFADESL